jgi:hypothetical protein
MHNIAAAKGGSVFISLEFEDEFDWFGGAGYGHLSPCVLELLQFAHLAMHALKRTLAPTTRAGAQW